MKCYVTLLENDYALLPFFIEWYRKRGATEFPTLVYGDRRLHEIAESMIGEGYSRLGTFHPTEFSARAREAAIASQHPTGEWAFFCDLDEFCEPLPKNYRDYAFIEGRWVDRVGLGGKLVDVNTAQPLEQQFPMASILPLRNVIRFGGPVYVASPFAPLLHHPNACARGRSRRRLAYVTRVHHFKWQTNILSRLEARISRMNPDQKAWRNRVLRQINHIKRHGGIDATLLQEVGSVLGV